MRRWIPLAALALVALAAVAPQALWAEDAGLRNSIPELRIVAEPDALVLDGPADEAVFRVFTDRAPYTGTQVIVPLIASNDQIVLSSDQALIDSDNWAEGVPITVTAAYADWPAYTSWVDLGPAESADTYYDGWDSPDRVRVSMLRRSIMAPLIARYWDGAYWETEPNNEIPQANGPVPHGTYIRGRLPSGDPQDYYWFELTEDPGTVVVSLSQIASGRNYDLVLRNAAGAQVGYSANLGSANERIEETLPAGVYYVQVFYRSGGGTTTPYLLRVWYK